MHKETLNQMIKTIKALKELNIMLLEENQKLVSNNPESRQDIINKLSTASDSIETNQQKAFEFSQLFAKSILSTLNEVFNDIEAFKSQAEKLPALPKDIAWLDGVQTLIDKMFDDYKITPQEKGPTECVEGVHK